MDLASSVALADELGRVDVIAVIAKAMMRWGDIEGALQTLAIAESRLLRSEADPYQMRTFVNAAVAIAGRERVLPVANQLLEVVGRNGQNRFVAAWALAEVGLSSAAFSLAESETSPKSRVQVLLRIAEVAATDGNRVTAQQAWDRALDIARSLGHVDERDGGWAMRDLARSLVDHEEHHRFRIAIVEARKHADGERSMCVQLAPLVAQAGDVAWARKVLRRAKGRERIPILLAIARAEHEAAPNLSGAAHRAFNEALAVANGSGTPRDRLYSLVELADASVALGNLDGAKEVLDCALEAASTTELLPGEVFSPSAMLCGVRACGRHGLWLQEASELLRRVEAWVDEAPRSFTTGDDLSWPASPMAELAVVEMKVAGTWWRLGHRDRARTRLDSSLALTKRSGGITHVAVHACVDLEGWQ